MKPLVSIITPALNAEGTIIRALKSALQQTYERIIVIVIDASPSDLTEKAVRSIHDSRVHYLRQIPGTRGQAAARNQGIAAFESNFVTFLDADDYYEPDKVAAQVRHLLDHPEHGAVYCDVLYRHADKPGLLMEGRWPTPSGQIAPALFEGTVVNINTLMCHRGFFIDGLAFEEKTAWPEDWQLCIRLATRGCSFGHVSRRLVNVELREGVNAPFERMHVMKKNTVDMIIDAVASTTDPECQRIGRRTITRQRRSYMLACLMGGRRDLVREAMNDCLPRGLGDAAYFASCLIPISTLRRVLEAVWKIGRNRHYRVITRTASSTLADS